MASGDLWAGAEAQVYQIVTALNRLPGVTAAAALLNEGELASRLRQTGVEVRVFPESAVGSWTIYRQLTAFMRAWRPDVVHTHRQKENILGALAARAAGASVCVRTTHGAAEFTPGVRQANKLALRRLDAWAARRLQQRVVAVSDDLAHKLTHALPGATICVIPNGIDVDSMRTAAQPAVALPRNVFHVAFIGRLVPVKRVDVFLRAAADLVFSGQATYRFHIIGDGPLRAALERQSFELDISNDCDFHGFRPDAPSLLAAMNCMVLTSDHEGLPMTTLEARALGIPVVAHAVGGLVPLLQDSSDCRLVATQVPSDYADAIRAVAAAPPLPSASRLPPRYSIGSTSGEYSTLYRVLLQQFRPRTQ